jgi:alkylation response protein AidB-like acyl-CoA dehydrogenase
MMRGVARAPSPASAASGHSAPIPPGGGDVARELRRMLAAGELDLPRPGGGRTARRWAALAGWGGRDLSLARLAEGHVDACSILTEAGRTPVPGALYGVWASRSGGAAVRVGRRGEACVLEGTLRFCSGARVLDRALVVADPERETPAGRQLLDVDVTRTEVEPLPGTWCTAAMADADTLDVRFADVPVDADADVGEPGWYVARRGFALGGAGVAAVWWGGAAAILDRAVGYLGGGPSQSPTSPTPPPPPTSGGPADGPRLTTATDRHALAHVGELHAALAAADALLRHTAALADGEGGADLTLAVATVRSAVERAVREVVDRVPRIVGPAPLSRDGGLAAALADLSLYVRQHHAERDHAALGELVLDRRRTP